MLSDDNLTEKYKLRNNCKYYDWLENQPSDGQREIKHQIPLRIRAQEFRPGTDYARPARIIQINSRSCKPNDYDSEDRMTHENRHSYHVMQPDFSLDKYDV